MTAGKSSILCHAKGNLITNLREFLKGDRRLSRGSAVQIETQLLKRNHVSSCATRATPSGGWGRAGGLGFPNPKHNSLTPQILNPTNIKAMRVAHQLRPRSVTCFDRGFTGVSRTMMSTNGCARKESFSIKTFCHCPLEFEKTHTSHSGKRVANF